jgi:hypothetical protein
LGIGDGIPPQDSKQTFHAENVFTGNAGIQIPQSIIVTRPQEGKGGNQSAGADAGDHFKLGAIAAGSPTAADPGAKGAVIAAAG